MTTCRLSEVDVDVISYALRLNYMMYQWVLFALSSVTYQRVCLTTLVSRQTCDFLGIMRMACTLSLAT